MDATGSNRTAYSFKLELPDGRWDVTEQPCPSAPRVGDLLLLADGGRWQVVGTQLVGARPAGKPPREFYVCAPAA